MFGWLKKCCKIYSNWRITKSITKQTVENVRNLNSVIMCLRPKIWNEILDNNHFLYIQRCKLRHSFIFGGGGGGIKVLHLKYLVVYLLHTVLDEADRMLDLGFSRDMNAIIENLPPERQTLLFSATQTKWVSSTSQQWVNICLDYIQLNIDWNSVPYRSVKDLARLSLKNPMFVSAHENAEHSTPTQLEQVRSQK